MHAWIWLATIALVFFGITGVTQKLSTNNISFELSFVWFCVAFLVIAAVIAATMTLDWRLTPGLVVFAALGGLLNGLGTLTSFAAFHKGGKASVVSPIINLYPLVTIAGAWMLLSERLTATQIAGIIMALLAVVLLSQEASPEKEL
ncbi:MAG TPA: EamA family transporter [Bryobacteraceae bacterium]|nr:EamA family transporter [Bryobacteraceae bacterium]